MQIVIIPENFIAYDKGNEIKLQINTVKEYSTYIIKKEFLLKHKLFNIYANYKVENELEKIKLIALTTPTIDSDELAISSIKIQSSIANERDKALYKKIQNMPKDYYLIGDNTTIDFLTDDFNEFSKNIKDLTLKEKRYIVKKGIKTNDKSNKL